MIVVLRLPPEQLRKFASGLELRSYEAGRTLAVRGGTDRVLFLVVSGLVEAVTGGDGPRAESLRSFTTGDLLGDWPLLEQRPWPATLIAREPVTVLARSPARGSRRCCSAIPIRGVCSMPSGASGTTRSSR